MWTRRIDIYNNSDNNMKKFDKVIKEYGKGTLHSGSKTGPKVTNPKQAIAIAFSEQRRARKGREKAKDTALKARTK